MGRITAIETADLPLLLTALQPFVGNVDLGQVLYCEHPGDPVAWQRAGHHGHFYTPQRTRDAEEALAWSLRRARGKRAPFRGRVAVALIFYRRFDRRGDIDNYGKLVLDSATQANVWDDDSQVAAKTAWMDVDPEHPRTVIAIGPYLARSRTPLFPDELINPTLERQVER